MAKSIVELTKKYKSLKRFWRRIDRKVIAMRGYDFHK